MPRKRPFIASMEEVRITRDGDEAIIEYADEGVRTTQLRFGKGELETLSDHDILDLFNNSIAVQEEFRTSHNYVAVEIPPGKPQIEYSEPSQQWVPRSTVLRSVIESDISGNPVICIDDKELSLSEFGGLLTTHTGWGMRIIFVDQYETHLQPEIEVKDLEEEEKKK